MRIVLYTTLFYPSVGGVETISRILAETFHKLGHEVVLLTTTPNPDSDQWPFQVVRNPSVWQLVRWFRWGQVNVHFGLSLKGYWPNLLLRRQGIITHHTWIKTRSMSEKLKLWVYKRSVNVLVSKALGSRFPLTHHVIHNCYQDKVFYPLSESDRPLDLVYLGRLVSIKGLSTLMEALYHLKTSYNQRPKLSVIGAGEDQQHLKQLAVDLSIHDQITFKGQISGQALNRELNQYKVIVIPSKWEEPFGIVALEGLAAGCLPVVSNMGGLPEAIGPCGLRFENKNAIALADQLFVALSDPWRRNQLLDHAPDHLKQFQPDVIARQYIRLFETILNQRSHQ